MARPFDPDVCAVSFFSDGILGGGVDTIYESPFPSLWQSRVDATNHHTKLKEESRVDGIGDAMYPGPDMVFFFELCNLNGRLTRCDAAVESDADLMDVAEHSLVSIGACLRQV